MKSGIFILLHTIPLYSFAQSYLWGDTLNFDDDRSVTAMLVDVANNMYVASVSYQPGDWIFAQYFCGNIYVRKYNPNGDLLWENIFTGKGHVFDMKLDNDGNLIGGGAFLDEISIGSDDFTTPHAWVAAAFLFKSDTSGNIQWALTETPAQNTIIWNIGIDNANNITVTGLKDDITALLKQYDTDGEFVWEKDLSNVRTSSGIVYDNDGNIFLSGTIDSYADFDGFDLPLAAPLTGYANYLAKFDAITLNTLEVWAVHYATFDFNSVLVKKDDNIFWHCNMQDAGGGFFLNDFIVKYNQLSGETDTIRNAPIDLFGFPLNYLSAGEDYLYITGYTFSDALIVRMDEEGNLMDTLVLPDMKYGFEELASIDSNLWIGGYISLDSLVLDTITLYCETDDYDQPFVARYGFHPVPEDTIADTVVVSFSDMASHAILLFPNPVKENTFYITTDRTIDNIWITDIAGKGITFTWKEINYQTIQLQLSEMPPGIYVSRVQSGEEIITGKILKE